MDYSKIKLGRPTTPRPQSALLPDLDYWDCFIYAKITNRSIADLIRTALIMYIRSPQRKEEFYRSLAVAANTEGMSSEEYYNKVVEENKKT